MIEFIGFPSIEQYRTVIKAVRERAQFAGLDADGKATFDPTKDLPTIKYRGTTKIHGTNASVCFDGTNLWAQSRNNVLTLTKDNCGFAFFVEANKEYFIEFISKLIQTPTFNVTVCVYGEWMGKGIQSGVAVSQVDKTFVIFAVKVKVSEEETTWMSDDYVKSVFDTLPKAESIKHILDFDVWEFDIDFANPELTQNKLIDVTLTVEAECPVGKKFGVSGVGEGIVLKPIGEEWASSKYWFKSKGEKHSVTKVKKLASVDVDKVNSVNEFAENTCTVNRMKQGLDYLREQGLDADVKNTGVYLKWLTSDIFKEETDVLIASGLEPKDVGKKISDIGRKWFMQQIG